MKLGEFVNKGVCSLENRIYGTKNCCEEKDSSIIRVAKLVGKVAIGLIALVLAPVYFTPFFAAGTLWGVYATLNKQNLDLSCGKLTGCMESFLEYLYQMKLPDEASFFFNAAIAIFHLVECPLVFSPMAGAVIGGWTGREVALIYDRYKEDEIVI